MGGGAGVGAGDNRFNRDRKRGRYWNRRGRGARLHPDKAWGRGARSLPLAALLPTSGGDGTAGDFRPLLLMLLEPEVAASSMSHAVREEDLHVCPKSPYYSDHHSTVHSQPNLN